MNKKAKCLSCERVFLISNMVKTEISGEYLCESCKDKGI